MFLHILSRAVENHAHPEKVFLKQKTPKLLKETLFDEECKNIQLNVQ